MEWLLKLQGFVSFLCLLVLTAGFVDSLPVRVEDSLEIETESVDSDVSHTTGASSLLPFLKRFGYLENVTASQSDHEGESEALYTKESVVKAIREMQKYGALAQTGVLDNETLALITKPRCGLPDVIHEDEVKRRKRFVVGAKGWNKRRLTYRVENWAPQLSESAVLSDIHKAFGAWADYARLRFVNKPRWNRDDVDISIAFGQGYHGDSYPFDGSGNVLAHAFFPFTHGALAGDIHFDLDENWRSSSNDSTQMDDQYSRNPISFLAVAIHEIGHSLGLAHSPSTDSLMFPYYQSYDQNSQDSAKIGYDDIMAMYQLYIQREIEDFPDEEEVEGVTPTTEFIPPSTTKSYESGTTRRTETTTVKPDVTSDKSVYPTTGSYGTNDPKPDLCRDGYDTISYIRNELFVFKDKFMWRFHKKGIMESPYPVKTSQFFPLLADVDRIDAAFENEDEILFFSGNQYWVYADNTISKPSYISDFGLPDSLERLDSAFVWGKNNKIYFFSESSFWRYNTTTAKMDEGYPKGIERWRGLPGSGIDSALTWSDGQTYFFKLNEFWRFDDAHVRTEEGFPLETNSYWFGC